MEQTTSRLRKTFRYPTDNDSDDILPEALDEEEQDNLIRTLESENTTSNKQYVLALLCISLVTTLLYIPSLFNSRTALFSLLSISSLLSTSYILYALPAGITSILTLYNLTAQNTPSASKDLWKRREIFHQASQDRGPLLTYLPYVNGALAGILGLLGWLEKERFVGNMWWGFEVVPGGVYVVVLIAKGFMGSVDPEADLGRLRYGFKGA